MQNDKTNNENDYIASAAHDIKNDVNKRNKSIQRAKCSPRQLSHKHPGHYLWSWTHKNLTLNSTSTEIYLYLDLSCSGKNSVKNPAPKLNGLLLVKYAKFPLYHNGTYHDLLQTGSTWQSESQSRRYESRRRSSAYSCIVSWVRQSKSEQL